MKWNENLEREEESKQSPRRRGHSPSKGWGGWIGSAHAGEMGMGKGGKIVGGSGHWRVKVGGRDEAAPANLSEPFDHICPLPQTLRRRSDTARDIF